MCTEAMHLFIFSIAQRYLPNRVKMQNLKWVGFKQGSFALSILALITQDQYISIEELLDIQCNKALSRIIKGVNSKYTK